MAGTSEHTPKARLLGAELRELRKQANITTRELAHRLGTSHVTISRYETGTRTPRPEDVARILGTLRVTGTRYDELIEFARNAGDKNTFARSSSGPHKHLVELAEFERSASSITDVAPTVIPGLLQTADYARSIMRGLPNPEREIRVGLRMARRDVLAGRAAKPLTAIIAEHALRQPLGGRAVMAEQLRYILRISEQSNITVAVLPNGLTHWTPAHEGAFVLYEFAKAPPIVQLEHYRSPAFLFEAKDVAAYKQAVVDIHTSILSVEASAGLIATIATEMEEA
ncbi:MULTISPECIES: helix-turn-helix transcriptional regulator [unclassified Saccharopolyspora]|uniref:helix-turn-helix domain-containing protein n=1 Tax=unclassified Saccharopolyspora TaxID=2646250 RepID=UPI001CD4DA2D|nr:MULTISPECIES: helix-turn-helix transcriptional regulator [unclassified Saccharopolyspora]MCA1186455.1 helix-turn-helix transcriptional regulator [Saccharopolyspora sp. 6T]MCA1193570.1 helix-turn-helix transcriptional regulator [Saccharopolyspora sp. 6V]MCA1227558.1 helix-turn-helix transcriptional regulator [Saccharopolyspora sp. 6M]MCA1280065.1 helix-turn-helix transcriptional regulator [Saccharopolyspora sp. 7B]